MEYRYLGDTGLKISAIGYGNMINSSPETVDVDDSLIFKCLEYGVNFFDTAEAYSDGRTIFMKVSVKKLWEELLRKAK